MDDDDDDAEFCSQVGCSADAVASYEWPGKGVMYACRRHALFADGLGRALGCPIVLRRLDWTPLDMDAFREGM